MNEIKHAFFLIFSMGIISSKAWAGLPLPMFNSPGSCFGAMTETQAFLLTNDGILWIGFVLWIAYIVFFFPKDTFKKV